MRFVHWCIAAALLANAVAYFWQDREPRGGLPHASDGLRDLVLLSELEEGSPADAATMQGGIAGDPTLSQAVAAGGRLPEGVGGADSGREADVIKETADEGAAGGAAVDATVPGGTERAAVLSDGGNTAAAARERCWLVGPVADDRISDELSARFAAASISMDLFLRTVEADPDYWVYMPNSGTQADMRRLSRELRQGGRENFPITNGPLAGSLSLGLFRDGNGARALVDELEDLGYTADIYLRPRYRDEAWISLDEAGRQALGWPNETGPVPGFERLMLEEESCEQ